MERRAYDAYGEIISKKTRVDEYCPLDNATWGFGEVLTRIEKQDPGYLTWKINIPLLIHPTKDSLYWAGWNAGSNIIATLAILFEIILSGIEVRLEKPLQDSVVQVKYLGMEPRKHGITAYIHPPAYEWLRSHRGQVMVGPLEAMVKADARMNNKELPSYHFRAEVHEDGRPSFYCPGDCCDLYVPAGSIGQSGSWPEELEMHHGNIDYDIQQLTLLAGLAAMCDEIRKFNPKQ